MDNPSLACNTPSEPFSDEPGARLACAVNDDPSAQACAIAYQEISEETGEGDTLFSLMNANIADEKSARGVAASLASAMGSALNKPFDINTPLKPGQRYSVTVDPEGAFLRATVEWDPANVFHVAVRNRSIHCWKEEVVLDFKVESVRFRMKGSLAESVLGAGESDELVAKLRNVFRWDIDFRAESVRGDMCKIVFERRYADDRPSGYGNILYAVYEGKKTKKTAILFNGEYYDAEGVALKKDFLRTPLGVIRVTSRFGRRFHPIHREWKKHNGVDYGAPQGTPVWAVSGGVVTFAGWQNGYGNYVRIKHDNGYESRYGHLQRFFVQTGQRVKQRQTIGLVGMTGTATGPHLDFQLLANNRHVNPLNVKMVPSLRTVAQPLKTRFATVTNERRALLEKVAFAELTSRSGTAQ
jgi:murein DD-endopeptidase MepM/ murein hydrolase activator NlpD